MRELAQKSGLVALEQEGLYRPEPFPQLQVLTLEQILTGQLPRFPYATLVPLKIGGFRRRRPKATRVSPLRLIDGQQRGADSNRRSPGLATADLMLAQVI